ncbi:hypothetical protein M0R45_035221 [Rubus argutus]|uniref:Uncharacterized protein n=1 Tax=Rubus argutus TaxID=59490 RepID=A0AAW1VSD8_RUBAR
MAIVSAKLCRSLLPIHCRLRKYCSINSISPSHALEETVKNAVEAKAYQKIPDLLISYEQACRNPNPFSFLSTFPHNLRMRVVDEILQSFIPLRPRSRAQSAYAYLLSFTLQSSNALPLALAILQRTLSLWLRSRCANPSSPIFCLADCRTEISGCLDSGEYILAGKVVMGMTDKGFIPYIRTRHKVVERLAGAGEWKLANAVRQRFAELRS